MSKKKIGTLVSFITVVIGSFFFYFSDDIEKLNNGITKVSSKNENKEVFLDGKLKVYYLDVGQADAILIKNNDQNMLIDAGNNEDGEKLVTYFKSLGITEFSYVVGTHAHEDHIGGMDDIINNFKIDKFYMPDAITTTKTFEDVLDALDDNNVKFETPEIDSKFTVGDGQVNILYTGTDTKDLNNSSIVLSMKYGNKTFLFMGDAPKSLEKNILNKEIEADVLKIGHHGSQYSTSDEFLEKVNPQYAIISVGKNNTYEHPKDVTLNKLTNKKVTVYRTDEAGTIIATTDGNKIDFETVKTDTNG